MDVSAVRELAPQPPADRFRVEPIEAMTFPDAFADAVISSAVLHFARDEAHFLAMLRGTWRTVRPGGLLFCRLASSIGLEHRNGNGVVEDAKGTEARFTLITQKGLTWYERGTAVIRDEAAKVGVASDVAPLEAAVMYQKLLACDITEGHLSSTLPHLANISYRVGRALVFDGAKETFAGDKEADRLLTRESYRKGFELQKSFT